MDKDTEITRIKNELAENVGHSVAAALAGKHLAGTPDNIGGSLDELRLAAREIIISMRADMYKFLGYVGATKSDVAALMSRVNGGEYQSDRDKFYTDIVDMFFSDTTLTRAVSVGLSEWIERAASDYGSTIEEAYTEILCDLIAQKWTLERPPEQPEKKRPPLPGVSKTLSLITAAKLMNYEFGYGNDGLSFRLTGTGGWIGKNQHDSEICSSLTVFGIDADFPTPTDRPVFTAVCSMAEYGELSGYKYPFCMPFTTIGNTMRGLGYETGSPPYRQMIEESLERMIGAARRLDIAKEAEAWGLDVRDWNKVFTIIPGEIDLITYANGVQADSLILYACPMYLRYAMATGKLHHLDIRYLTPPPRMRMAETLLGLRDWLANRIVIMYRSATVQPVINIQNAMQELGLSLTPGGRQRFMHNVEAFLNAWSRPTPKGDDPPYIRFIRGYSRGKRGREIVNYNIHLLEYTPGTFAEWNSLPWGKSVDFAGKIGRGYPLDSDKLTP